MATRAFYCVIMLVIILSYRTSNINYLLKSIFLKQNFFFLFLTLFTFFKFIFLFVWYIARYSRTGGVFLNSCSHWNVFEFNAKRKMKSYVWVLLYWLLFCLCLNWKVICLPVPMCMHMILKIKRESVYV